MLLLGMVVAGNGPATVSCVLCLTGWNPEIHKLSIEDPANPGMALGILAGGECNFADGGLGLGLFGDGDRW